MSKPQKEDSIQNKEGGEIVPRVMIAVGGPERHINYDYPNSEVRFSINKNPPTCFNEWRQESLFDIFVFMNNEYNFSNNTSLSQIVNTLWNEDYGQIGGIYSDAQMKSGDHLVTAKLHPSYNKKIYNQKIMMNIPFIVKSAIVPSFHEQFQDLYLWDGLLTTMRQTLVFHRACLDYTIERFVQSSNLQKEVDTIHAIF